MTTPAGANDDDEMELINAEFESMVAGLSLDESSPRTYLDELDEIVGHHFGAQAHGNTFHALCQH